KPSMQLQRKGQLALDAEVTIRCRGPEKALRFSLLRSKQIKASQLAEPDSRVATFRIFMGTWKDAGGYTCRYHHKEHPFVWSNQSNPVELILRGEELTLEFCIPPPCLGNAPEMFEEDRSTAEFPLSLMSPEDAGTYACQYHRKGKRFLLSEPSDPVELRLRGERLPSSSVLPGDEIKVGERVDFSCESKHYKHYERPTFYFFKEGTPGRLQVKWKKPLFPFRRAQFYIPNAQPGDGGTYWCAYCFSTAYSQTCSKPSRIHHINIAGEYPTLSRPSIRIRPKPQISLGLNATIECQGPEYYFHLTFFLFKSGNLIASQKEEPMKNTTQFLLSSVRLEDAGSYSCRYQRIVPFAQSEPSDAVELTVTGEGNVGAWKPTSLLSSSCQGDLHNALWCFCIGFFPLAIDLPETCIVFIERQVGKEKPQFCATKIYSACVYILGAAACVSFLCIKN
uniref:Ig-like domain-containing protein n=1 Tax=Varanus komodoensis TaxID=61221 RepID=A0A8D2Q6U5_VARKO